MNRNALVLAILLAALAMAGVGYYFYQKDAVPVWRAKVLRQNLIGENNMVAAVRLLEQHKQTVTDAETMHDALRNGLPNGTLFITNNQGFLLPNQVKLMQDWVEKGNTLIMLPNNPDKYKAKAKSDEDAPKRKFGAKSEADEERAERKRLENAEREEEEIEAAPPATPANVVPKKNPETPKKGEGGGPAEGMESASGERASADLPATAASEQASSDDANAADAANTTDAADPVSGETPDESAKTNEAAEDGLAEETSAEDSGGNPAKKLELDPFGKLMQVQRSYRRLDGRCRKSDLGTCATFALQLPKLSYPLHIAPSYMVLKGVGLPDKLVLADSDKEAVRIYSVGQGQIVTLAENYFDNRNLARLDHAQLLLYLTNLSIDSKHTMLVRNLDFLPWYEALWENGKAALVSVAVICMLLLWMAMRRFGPILPEAEVQRRAMIEHIDASGRWLWHLPGGPDLLLAAARASTTALLRKRIPEWGRLSPQEQVERLVQETKLAEPKLWQALHEKTMPQAVQFTTQVQTLQLLRKHYERK